MKSQKQEKTVRDLHETVRILIDTIELCRAGRRHHYQTIAVQLRKLLCDKSRGEDQSLLFRVMPDLKFQAFPDIPSEARDLIDAGGTMPGKKLVTYCPSVICSHIPGVYALIDEDTARISVRDWLEQLILCGDTTKGIFSTITVRQLIRSVADTIGAHSDLVYNPSLALGMETKTDGYAEGEDIFISLTIALGEYVTGEITERLAIQFLKRREPAHPSVYLKNMAIILSE